MRGRDFIGLLGGAAAIPFVAHARQSERMRSIACCCPQVRTILSFIPHIRFGCG